MGEKNQPSEQTKEADAQESNKMEINMNRIQQMKKKRFASKKKDSSAKMFWARRRNKRGRWYIF